MRWQIIVETAPGRPDSLATTVAARLEALGLAHGAELTTRRLFDLEGDLDQAGAERLAGELLKDDVTETATVHAWDGYDGQEDGRIAVFRKQGVMDPVEASILRAAARLGVALERAATGTSYHFTAGVPAERLTEICTSCLANPAIEDVVTGDDRFPARRPWGEKATGRREIPVTTVDDAELERISKEGGLSLTLLEMQAVAEHYRGVGREPTEIELETVAQTWSEHCKHKTLAGAVRYEGDAVPGESGSFEVKNLLAVTIKEATETLDRDFCLSVFHDNAGVIAFEGDDALCIKVETHNHPSAIEPYGGAGTGIGGVIRDILGTGLGARPVANVDVFCVAPPDMPAEELPKGTLHPIRLLKGVVSGVRDYGNQMGIPTVSGAVLFDERYVGNPLVYAGTVGMMPTDCVDKKVSPGDRIVALGGRTGRDGIHGATFSSVELHEESETLDSGAVQIGDAITEKKVLDVLLQARDRKLFSAVTDCGAGGFSSAVGEMGEETGAIVDLETAPLKYAGLSPTEIWISEAQERMVFSVPEENVEELLALAASEDVEAVVLGTFTDDKRLVLKHEGEVVGDIGMEFLHDGLPRVVREATWQAPPAQALAPASANDWNDHLLELLAEPNVASKEWIIRQYDHEVRAGSVVKPLVGTRGQGPSDGSVVAPRLGSTAGFALGVGMNPWYGDLDPYHMARAGIDEAVRNVVAVGGDPDHCAILDNFSWGNTSKPDRLGGLLRCCYGCKDAAIDLGTPFVSGKDSLNNEYRVGDRTIVIPPSLLVTALAKVPDVTQAVTMDFKSSGNEVFVLGMTRDEMGGSLHARMSGGGGSVPEQDGKEALATFRALHAAMKNGLVRSCHDLSEGGLAVALAEMVLSGEVGAEIALEAVPLTGGDAEPARTRLFSESLSRFVLEVTPENVAALEKALEGRTLARIGRTCDHQRLVVTDGGKPLVDAEASILERAFRGGLTNHLEASHASGA